MCQGKRRKYLRAIVVEDNRLMTAVFMGMSQNIDDLFVEGTFTNGVECAKKLREKMPELLIVFISVHEDYVRESNQIGGDDYLVKPYSEATIRATMENTYCHSS